MIEACDLGGTCPNRGCTPKKVLVAAAHALHDIERAAEHRITVGGPTLDWAGLIDREQAMVRDVPDRLEGLMAKRGVHVIRGKARFVGRNAVEVDGRRLEAANIATGSRPRTLPIPGAELMITSDEVLSDRELPHDVVFVGGGVISFELGHVYARAGANVTIIEALPQMLGGVDADAVEQIRVESERIGIRLLTLALVKHIERAGRRLRVTFQRSNAEHTIEVDRVVNCVGRIAAVDSLDLEAGGVLHYEQRIDLDESLRSTSNPLVHLCGDAVWNSPQLSPIATYEGRIVGRNIVEGAMHKPDYSSIPSSVYTVPAVASVGLTETAAKERGLSVDVHMNDMRSWLTGRTFAETVAWSKVIVDNASNEILGAHIVGHAGEELIHLFALAMRHRITARDLADGIFAFPTFSSDIRNMI